MKRGRPHGNSGLVPAWLLRSRYEIETPEGVTRQTAEMELLEAGWRHFDAAEWAEARDTFRALLEASPREPAALDGLGQSLWWLGDRDAAIECRREAYAAYRRDGDARNAGRLAVYLAGERRIDGQIAEASGWLSRARRLLEGEGTCVELGWLAIEDAKRAGNPRMRSVTPTLRSRSRTRSRIRTSSAWHWRRWAVPSWRRGGSTRVWRCSTRR